MTFATFEEMTGTAWATAGTTQTGNFPSAVGVDDLLILTIGKDGTSATVSGVTDAFSGSWVEVIDGATGIRGAVFYKRAIGGEDGGTFAVAITGSEAGACLLARFSNYDWDNTPENSTVLVGTVGSSTDSVTFTAVTASWGSDDNTFIPCVGYNDDDATNVNYSTTYSNGTTQLSGAGTNASGAAAMATKEVAADTHATGGWTLSENEGCMRTVVVIGPAAGDAVPTINLAMAPYTPAA